MSSDAPEVVEEAIPEIVSAEAEVPAVGEEISAEQREAAFKVARKLAEKPEINMAMMAMVLGRQLYNMSAYAMHGHMVREGAGLLVEEVFVQSAANRANEEFKADDLLQKLSTVGLAFVQHEIRADAEAAAAESQEAQKEEEALRRSLEVPLGFAVAGSTTIPRDRPLILAGPAKLVAYLLGLVVNAAGNEPDFRDRRKVVVAHLITALGTPTVNITDKDKTYVRIGAGQTTGVANSHKTFDKFMSMWRRQTYKNRMDLLVVEHAPGLFTAGVSGRSEFSNAASAIQTLTKWATAAGSAIVAGIQCDPQEALNESGSVWASLKEHAQVVVVQFGPAPDGQEDHVSIKLGDDEGSLLIAKQLVE